MIGAAAQTFDYDVALSYAAEDRAYVQRVAAELQKHDIRLFYDEYATAELWGKDLYEVLDDVYRKRARFTVAFISSHYASKPWTRHERRSFQARALMEVDPYLLPVRLDDSEIPGLPSTISYIDARKTSVEELIQLIKLKLSSSPGMTNPEQPKLLVPRNADQQRELLAQRPPAWEYLLYAGVLWQRRQALEAKWRDHQLGYGRRTGRHFNDREAIDFVSNVFKDLSAAGPNILRMLDKRAQEQAFGLPGEPGNPELIEHIATRLVEVYENIMDMASTLRGAGVSGILAPYLEASARLTDTPLREIRDFVDEFVAMADGLPDRIAAGESIVVQMKLTLTIDDEALADLSRERKIAAGHLGLEVDD